RAPSRLRHSRRDQRGELGCEDYDSHWLACVSRYVHLASDPAVNCRECTRPFLVVNANEDAQRKAYLTGSAYWRSSASTRHTTALLDQKCGVGEEKIGRVVMKQVS